MVTYNLYSSLHSKVSESEFAAAETEAEFDVRSVIGPRFDSITSTTYGYSILQETICRVIDLNAEAKQSAAGKGLASVSNDGYTENYEIKTAEEAHAQKRDSIIAWLSGTGMVGAY